MDISSSKAILALRLYGQVASLDGSLANDIRDEREHSCALIATYY